MWTVYATTTCIWCKRAKGFLEERNEPLNYVILDHNTLNGYLKEFPDAKTVPQIITPDGVKIGGFDALVDYYK